MCRWPSVIPGGHEIISLVFMPHHNTANVVQNLEKSKQASANSPTWLPLPVHISSEDAVYKPETCQLVNSHTIVIQHS